MSHVRTYSTIGIYTIEWYVQNLILTKTPFWSFLNLGWLLYVWCVECNCRNNWQNTYFTANYNYVENGLGKVLKTLWKITKLMSQLATITFESNGLHKNSIVTSSILTAYWWHKTFFVYQYQRITWI